VADFCFERPMLRRVVRQIALMDRLMERVGVDPGAAARDGGGAAWYEARSKCIACCSGKQCRDWLASQPSASPSEPPEFCHNAEFLKRCRKLATAQQPDALPSR
jgi:hypothetical protein